MLERACRRWVARSVCVYGAKSFALHSRRRSRKIEARRDATPCRAAAACCTPTKRVQCGRGDPRIRGFRPDGNSARPVCIIRVTLQPARNLNSIVPLPPRRRRGRCSQSRQGAAVLCVHECVRRGHRVSGPPSLTAGLPGSSEISEARLSKCRLGRPAPNC